MKRFFKKIRVATERGAFRRWQWLQGIKQRSRLALGNCNAEGFVDNAISILIAVVIGALLLAGLYKLFGETVLPQLQQRIIDMFNYRG